MPRGFQPRIPLTRGRNWGGAASFSPVVAPGEVVVMGGGCISPFGVLPVGGTQRRCRLAFPAAGSGGAGANPPSPPPLPPPRVRKTLSAYPGGVVRLLPPLHPQLLLAAFHSSGWLPERAGVTCPSPGIARSLNKGSGSAARPPLGATRAAPPAPPTPRGCPGSSRLPAPALPRRAPSPLRLRFSPPLSSSSSPGKSEVSC